ncbi:ankyrin repeat domain-containing protein [bacterium]|jgi:ankyrin repeat protein|nr:ankyrin repeat domain-containing protein [bacterium]
MKQIDKNIDIIDIIENGTSQRLKKVLLSNDIDVNICDKNDRTPLMVACRIGSFSKVKILIENGSNINASDFYQDTCLHWSCVFPNYKIIKYLLLNGANPNNKNDINNIPLCGLSNDFVNKIEYENIIRLFIKYDTNIFYKDAIIFKNILKLLKESKWQIYFIKYQLHNINILRKYIKLNDDVLDKCDWMLDNNDIGLM